MNILAAFTAAMSATVAAAFQADVLPKKWAPYAMLAAIAIQAFQGSIHKPDPNKADPNASKAPAQATPATA